MTTKNPAAVALGSIRTPKKTRAGRANMRKAREVALANAAARRAKKYINDPDGLAKAIKRAALARKSYAERKAKTSNK